MTEHTTLPMVYLLAKASAPQILEWGHQRLQFLGFAEEVLIVQIRSPQPTVTAVGVEGVAGVHDAQVIEDGARASWELGLDA